MAGSRLQAAAILVFVAGLAAALFGMRQYDESYAWVAHTTDVRVAIGLAVEDAGHAPSCEGLRSAVATFARLTADNQLQQSRLPAVQASVDAICHSDAAPELIDQLSELDATERELMTTRRARLAETRRWVIAAFVLATLGAIAALTAARVLQQRALRALADGEERFRMLATSSRDLVRIHDAAGRPTYVSPSVEHVLGYTAAELLAMPPLSLGHPDDLDRMRATLTDVQSPGAPGTTLVYRLRAKDGSFRWFETHTNPIRDEAGALVRFYTTARDITERVELERKLELVAVTDELTGLLNRRGFLMIAGQEHRLAIRHQQRLAVIFADLDGLKIINDRLGHDEGDRALRQFGEILRATFRESDVVARLGGDEYAALAYDVDQGAVDRVLDRLRAAVASAPRSGPYPMSVSLGVALLESGETTSLDDLLARADEQMYANKRAQRASSG